MCDVWDRLAGVYDAAINPVLVAVNRAISGSPRIAGPLPTGMHARVAAAANEEAYTVGVPQQVDVYVDFSSLSAEDVNGPPVLAALVQKFNQLASEWDTIREKFSVLDVPALALPATPRVSIQKKVPGGYLGVRAVTPTPIAGSGAGDETWMVTFANPAQGDDHQFSYTVRFAYPGFPDQERTLAGVLQPSQYSEQDDARPVGCAPRAVARDVHVRPPAGAGARDRYQSSVSASSRRVT